MHTNAAPKKEASGKHHMLLLGASVGDAWDLAHWADRTKNSSYIFESVAVYAFDKTEALQEILMRPRRKFRISRSYLKGLLNGPPQKPVSIIIKECAAYFPGDLEKYKALIKQWISMCKEAGVKPIIATVVPVTIEHDAKRTGRLQGILAYNDWVRAYTKENSLECFDLESVLRISENHRALRPELTSGDGLHLNAAAYNLLDAFLELEAPRLID